MGLLFPNQLSQMIVNSGGVAAVIDYLGDCKGAMRLPGIMMLGYVAAHAENLAMAVILSKVSPIRAESNSAYHATVRYIQFLH